jgi:hypothetical protein
LTLVKEEINMSKYIKVEDACAEVDRGDLLVGNNAEWAKEIICRTKPADVKEVVRSSWILNKDGSGTCKHCRRTTRAAWDCDSWMRYCPSCGAQMVDAEVR